MLSAFSRVILLTRQCLCITVSAPILRLDFMALLGVLIGVYPYFDCVIDVCPKSTYFSNHLDLISIYIPFIAN